jgi:hypothetical protein
MRIRGHRGQSRADAARDEHAVESAARPNNKEDAGDWSHTFVCEFQDLILVYPRADPKT